MGLKEHLEKRELEEYNDRKVRELEKTYKEMIKSVRSGELPSDYYKGMETFKNMSSITDGDRKTISRVMEMKAELKAERERAEEQETKAEIMREVLNDRSIEINRFNVDKFERGLDKEQEADYWKRLLEIDQQGKKEEE
jgi:hypothetical protein